MICIPSRLQIELVRRRHPRAGRQLAARSPQALLQRRQELQHNSWSAVEPHQAYAPGLALEVAETAADLDAEVVQQSLPHRQVHDPCRDAHRIELRKSITL